MKNMYTMPTSSYSALSSTNLFQKHWSWFLYLQKNQFSESFSDNNNNKQLAKFLVDSDVKFTNLSIFNIYFLRKEKIYTKLKYSRTPQYDIVSGGVAALFAGFLGFLISEKFGFELVDSGDFYILLMYVVFLFGMTRFLLKFMSLYTSKNISLFSISWIITFWKNWCILLFKKIQSLF